MRGAEGPMGLTGVPGAIGPPGHDGIKGQQGETGDVVSLSCKIVACNGTLIDSLNRQCKILYCHTGSARSSRQSRAART